MGGNSRQKKFPSVFNIFKTKKSSSRKVEDSRDDSIKVYKVWTSDEDRGRSVAEPGIDRKASAYIAKIHAAAHYVSEN